MNENNAESWDTYTTNGHAWKSGISSGADLVNVPERIERYQLVAFSVNGSMLVKNRNHFASFDEAKQHRYSYESVVKITTEDGKLISIEVVREEEA
jgi:hypothetical protein